MFGEFLGDLISLPFKLAAVPTKVLKAVDDSTAQSGVGKEVDDLIGEPLAETGRRIQEELRELDE